MYLDLRIGSNGFRYKGPLKLKAHYSPSLSCFSESILKYFNKKVLNIPCTVKVLQGPYRLYQLYKPFIKETPAKLYQSHSLID